MLKAYDSIESYDLNAGIVSESIFKREKDLARIFVQGHDIQTVTSSCPICGHTEVASFAEFFNVPYYRCGQCWSIFTPVRQDVLEAYNNCEPLNTFRLSSEYQQFALERREVIWKELLFWIQFRSMRFLGCGSALDVVDYGDHYEGLSRLLRESSLCNTYHLTGSILPEKKDMPADETANIVLYLDQITHEADLAGRLRSFWQCLKPNGLLIISTRVGTGFDILTLRSKLHNIIPYEHSVLPSIKGLENLLESAGFEMLERLTPGTLDAKYVYDNRAALGEDSLFIKYLLQLDDSAVLAEFQNFLQKSGLSSHARVIARKLN